LATSRGRDGDPAMSRGWGEVAGGRRWPASPAGGGSLIHESMAAEYGGSGVGR
jgi:hypothetical protein